MVSVARICLIVVLFGTLTVACSFIPPKSRAPLVVAVDSQASAIGRAIEYLYRTQVAVPNEGKAGGDWAGNWPQTVHFTALPGYRVREISPYIPTYIHHALTLIVADHAAALDLTADDLARAQQMRRRAVRFMKRFRIKLDDPAVGAFGFWPDRDPYRSLSERLVGGLTRHLLIGPRQYGRLAPPYLRAFPPEFQVWPDADDTAVVYVALRAHAELDAGPVVTAPIQTLFARWRDLGQAVRGPPAWLEPGSGAFLTWMPPPFAPAIENDVDLMVNANVLFALARYRGLDTPGVAEAIDLITRATQERRHRRPETLSIYSPSSLVFHYIVSRAYYDGPVPGLGPAVKILADELVQGAVVAADGTVSWNHVDPHLDTAFAVLTLLNAGRSGPLVDGGIRFLRAAQDRRQGNWRAAPLFQGETGSKLVIQWTSPALTTALALEALSRYALLQAGGIKR